MHKQVLLLGQLAILVLVCSATLGAAPSEPKKTAAQQLPDLDLIIQMLKRNEAKAAAFRVQTEAKVRQRQEFRRDAPELKREIATRFAVDEKGRLRSEVEGGTPGRIGKLEVLPKREIGAFDGTLLRTLSGPKDFIHAYIGPDKYRISREVDPRDYLHHYYNTPISQTLVDNKYKVLALDKWNGRDVIAVESKSVFADGIRFKSRLLLDPAMDYTAVVRSSLLQYDDLGHEWAENARTESSKHARVPVAKDGKAADGVWVPVRGLHTSYIANREEVKLGQPLAIAWQFDVTFHHWELNPKFTDADFTLDFPPGIHVQDERK